VFFMLNAPIRPLTSFGVVTRASSATPSCLDQARRIHAIPIKKTHQALVSYLTRDELQALLDAPDTSTLSGIRDRAMLLLTFAAGLRVSERVGLRLRSDRPPGRVHVAHHRRGRR
jgi:integrase/recombinase XerD